MRKQEHIQEMIKTATFDGYLTNTIKQVRTTVNKSKIEYDKKKCILECLPAIRNYGTHANTRDPVLKFLEDILDGTLDMHETKCLNKMYELLEECEHFDVKDGEASQRKKRVKEIISKYSKGNHNKSTSSHSLPEVMHFRNEMEGSY